jgi:L-histidine Nalpha-methyltransferase
MHTFSILTASGIKRYPSKEDGSSFHLDVIRGLNAKPKRLDSKYFYDAQGDDLFRQIMQLPEYYPTACEREILSAQAPDIIQTIRTLTGEFDLVELGAGDASKTRILLRELLDQGIDFTYFPVDISSNVINSLDQSLPAQFPNLRWKGLQGEYMDMLRKVGALSLRHKVVLFMGANIGNFHFHEALEFCGEVREQLQPGDLFIAGFDLKKEPWTILSAYNDPQGVTKAFNLNLLHRINRELGADFRVQDFEHYPTYDPVNGSCKSYLISLRAQDVHIGDDKFSFEQNEPVSMEISQKYSLEETSEMAQACGFFPVRAFLDSRGWFADCLWGVE